MTEEAPSRTHRHLARQLRKLKLDEDVAPSLEKWRAFLQGVGKSYEDTDLERYTLERSVGLFEREMQQLNTRLEAERDHLRLIFEAAPVGIIRSEPDGRVTMVNAALQRMLGYTEADMLGLDIGLLVHPEDREAVVAALRGSVDGQVKGPITTTRRLLHRSGRTVHVNKSVSVVMDAERRPLFTIAVVNDISEKIQLEVELRHAQKLESVGRLAAGIAHEINTPVQFVGDSVRFMNEAVESFIAILTAHRAFGQRMSAEPAFAADAMALAVAEDAADIPYLLENVPGAVARCLEGLDRVATIVRSMKEFAHPDAREKRPQDLNHAIDTTLAIARNEYKYVADVETSFGELPPVMCHVGEMNQVVLNIIVNAAHAIGDVVRGTNERGTIRIATRLEGGDAVIAISDTGSGIPPAVQERVFEPFFTTKEVGRGTGQGLAISRSVVVDKHGGSLTFETEGGKGTTFIIRLPIGDSSSSTATV
jgi:PAS domain S-box-containing protein